MWSSRERLGQERSLAGWRLPALRSPLLWYRRPNAKPGVLVLVVPALALAADPRATDTKLLYDNFERRCAALLNIIVITRPATTSRRSLLRSPRASTLLGNT